MFVRIRTLLRKWFGFASHNNDASAPLRQPNAVASSDPDENDVPPTHLAHSSSSHLVAYDENLLERSRTQWQFGDWVSLARLSRETLQHHPDRAKLALLAASGHQALGNVAEARQFIRLAIDWGCSKRLVSQILIAGLHNTLARASAIGGNHQRSLNHFDSAVATVHPGSEHRLIARARAREEIERLGVLANGTDRANPSSVEGSVPVRVGTRVEPIEWNHELAIQMHQQSADVAEQIRKQNNDIAALKQALESTVKREMQNATKQLEAFLGIQSYLQQGERLPSMHGWPISPDFALYMIELVDSNDYDLIIEFGSGTSTVLIAKTLARNAHHRKGKSPTVQIAFEHLEQYHAQTQTHLQQAKLEHAVQLILAPLQPYIAPNGQAFMYYGCQDTLSKFALIMSDTASRILLLVDGPPAVTGKHARYPALPVVMAHFKGSHIDILLDDYIREDEKEIVQLWLKDIEEAGIRSSMSTKKMEKDACLISIHQYKQ